MLTTTLKSAIEEKRSAKRTVQRNCAALDSDETPLRAELFSREQLTAHARTIAAQHLVCFKEGENRWLARLDENEKILRDFNRATLTTERTRRVTPAAEWLLDNAYLIEEQIKTARRHLPRNYSRELPRLAAGPCAGLPRVYAVVLELISHVDAQIDLESLRAFVVAYQTVNPLNLGELWAVPSMLRLGLIENLRRITVRLGKDRNDRDLADFWASRVELVLETNPINLVTVVGDMATAKVPTSSAFVTEFCQRLTPLAPAVQAARDWIERLLSAAGLSIEQCILDESQNQAANQVSISHTIASLRLLGAAAWREFVEAVSVVDHTLSNDPAEVYRRSDFATRDSYRHTIENIARHSQISENDVARKAIELAEQAAREKGLRDRAAHVGYYLVGKGSPQLEAAVQVTWPWATRIENGIRRFPLTFYLGGIGCLLLASMYWLLRHTQDLDLRGGKLVFIMSVSLVCLSQLSIALMNWLSMLLIKPRLLPRLDFSAGIPADCQTMVVVPTLLTHPGAVDRLVETMEIHFLANRDPHLQFALLTDFCDAGEEQMPQDAALVQRVQQGVEALNRKYGPENSNRFFLFHRPRRWNPAEGVWMGYERKRGKLGEFNALLRGRGRDHFSHIVGDVSRFDEIRFVITLDTDTQLPREAARRLAGTLAHPLNRPLFESGQEIVREGYSILQPRVAVRLPSASRSWFVRLFAGDCGLDPYTRMVSDVYQDLFHEGSFVGKGIYDVDAFERAVHGRFPENRVLSHDLIESVHARSALVTDVELFEDHPSRYNADVNRRHRWVRGDWQIGQWLLPRVPGPDARRIANPLSGLSRWKLFDNLRRSLVPAALVFLLLSDWVLWPGLNGLGEIIVLLVVLLPAAFCALREIVTPPEECPLAVHLRAMARVIARQIGQIAFTLAVLPYDAYVSLDAIGRTLVRSCCTGKRLLEWQTASDAERYAQTDLPGFYRTMWIAPMLSTAMGTYLFALRPELLVAAAPLLTGWLVAPWIAWWLSQPIPPSEPGLSAKQLAFLGTTARRTWRFFETFVTAEEHWLPPDYYQEHPTPRVASRTSPTNMGLALLSNLAACDFGYLSVRQLVERTRNALASMQTLERHRGHFFNWYDTRNLQPLPPRYVSTVDSGNLAGHLLTLNAGLKEYADRAILGPEVARGLRDTSQVLLEYIGKSPQLECFAHTLAAAPVDLSDGYVWLQELTRQAGEIAKSCAQRSGEAKWWSGALERSCREHLENLVFFAPWLPTLVPLMAAEAEEQCAVAIPGTDQRVGTPPHGDSEVQPGTDAALRCLFARLRHVPTLREIAGSESSIVLQIEELLTQAAASGAPNGARTRLGQLLLAVHQGSGRARETIQHLESTALRAEKLANMDFSFLYDSERELFAIGYNADDHRRDPSYYDLLASESRLTSYVAIAQGQVPQRHWFSMGRLLTSSSGEAVLVSWSGSMFEYLMPLLVMPTYDKTLLDQACRGAVRAQIKYGQLRGIPWGISESGYNMTDAQFNYQYRAFGVPGLGFKRGLGDDLVIAPYASVMALMLAPKAACLNLERLAAEERRGQFGFYEAVDYTPSRLPPNESSVPIRSFMAHHEGMSLLSLACFLLDEPMQRRFLSHTPFMADELLLQERLPKAIASLSEESLAPGKSPALPSRGGAVLRVVSDPNTPAPEVHLLSNGRYNVLVTHAGGGYSRWLDLAVTRWREDAPHDCWGSFCYLRDVKSNVSWSATYEPLRQLGERYEAIFTQARAEFRQRHGAIETHTEISVSPEDDVELRRLSLTNHSNGARTIEVTSYAEVALDSQRADAAQPAFSKHLVQTEFIRQHSALLITRRARAIEEQSPWLFHLVVVNGAEEGEFCFETDRIKFIGRGRSLVSPAAMQGSGPLSNTIGPVLDPIVSLRRTVVIPPEGTVQIAIVTGIGRTREAAGALVEKYDNLRMADRVFNLAWTHSQVMVRHLDATEADAQLYARMAGALVFANPARGTNPNMLRNNRRGHKGLWGYGISGDLPIVLLRVSGAGPMEIVRRLIQAHAYWRMKGLAVELVILNEDSSVYRQFLQDRITGLILSSTESQMLDRPGGIFVRRGEQIPLEDRLLLQAVARLVLADEGGSLEQQLQRRGLSESPTPDLKPIRPSQAGNPVRSSQRELAFFGGWGGFTPDGREYIITLETHPPVSLPKRPFCRSEFSPGESPRPESPQKRIDAGVQSENEGQLTDPTRSTPEPGDPSWFYTGTGL